MASYRRSEVLEPSSEEESFPRVESQGGVAKPYRMNLAKPFRGSVAKPYYQTDQSEETVPLTELKVSK
jgi:hypothetical protein